MKKLLLTLTLVATLSMGFAQQVSSRAKAMRMMTYAHPEFMVKDIKVYTDTMTVYSMADQVIYPIGKWETVDQYVTNTGIHWYREVGYKNFFDSMTVSVNTLRRLDGSYINLFRSIPTGKCEILEGKITDTAIVLDNGVRVGMNKMDVFSVIFNKFPRSYVADVSVLKVISAANEVAVIYTFKGSKLRHIQIKSKYKYY